MEPGVLDPSYILFSINIEDVLCMYLVSAQAAAGTWLVELILMAILCLNGAVAQTPYILLHLKIALARHYNRFERTGIFAD